MNFYKIERPTTNSGLSTWILLSGQNTMTTKPPKKSIIKPNNSEDKKHVEQPKQNVTVVVVENVNRTPKPIFKKRMTTLKPVNKTVTTTIATKTTATTIAPKTTAATVATTKEAKLTKVKASILNNAFIKKSNVTTNATDVKVVKKTPTTTQKPTTLTTTTKIIPVIKKNSTLNTIDSNNLPMEGKDGDTDLQNTNDSSKKKKTPAKRKKNKTRRRKPDLEKSEGSNSTKIDKHKVKQKPMATQLYNYLSREVMPTVGVGLVGLMVTAGLASYFLYPFGAARRSYDIDRKDKEGAYYYDDDYSGGIAEEEAIGKVIAGMPANSYYNNVYKSPTSRHAYPNMRYRNVDVRKTEGNVVKGTVESVPLALDQGYKDSYLSAAQNYRDSGYYNPQSYKNEENQEKKFVVGSVPKEIVTASETKPVNIPEHGPRNLKLRKKRDLDEGNELNSTFTENNEPEIKSTTTPTVTTTEPSTTTENLPDKYVSIISLIKDLFHLKIRMGLQIIQNATQSISNYVSRVQTRLDEHYKNQTRTRQ